MLDFNFAELTLPSALKLLFQIYFNGIFPGVALVFILSRTGHNWRIMMLEELAVIFESIIFAAAALVPFTLLENDTLTWFEYIGTFVVALIPIWLLSITFGNKKPIMFRVFFDLHLYFCTNEIFSWYTTNGAGSGYKAGALGTIHFYFTNIAMLRMIYLSIREVINEVTATALKQIGKPKRQHARIVKDANNNCVK